MFVRWDTGGIKRGRAGDGEVLIWTLSSGLGEDEDEDAVLKA